MEEHDGRRYSRCNRDLVIVVDHCCGSMAVVVVDWAVQYFRVAVEVDAVVVVERFLDFGSAVVDEIPVEKWAVSCVVAGTEIAVRLQRAMLVSNDFPNWEIVPMDCQVLDDTTVGNDGHWYGSCCDWVGRRDWDGDWD